MENGNGKITSDAQRFRPLHQISIFVPFETMQCNLPYVKMDCFRCLINGGEIWENIMLIDKYIIQRVFR